MSFSTFEEIVRRIEALPAPALIGIDGLPCSGKSTLADGLQKQFGIEGVYVDEFLLPSDAWPSDIAPAFPFPYMRHAEFIAAIEALAADGEASYFPVDWAKLQIAGEPRTVRLTDHVLVEGVSSLTPVIAPFYGISIFVDSDRVTAFQAAMDRDGGWWADEWRTLFLPSTDLYMRTDPRSRADLIFAGRDGGNRTA